jgi:hypothetical protein
MALVIQHFWPRWINKDVSAANCNSINRFHKDQCHSNSSKRKRLRCRHDSPRHEVRNDDNDDGVIDHYKTNDESPKI